MTLVLVTHPDVGEALVPSSALRQMSPRWRLVEATPEPTATTEEPKPARRPRDKDDD